MNKDEISKLSDLELMAEWEQIKAAYQMHLPAHLSNHQSLILFAMFVNIGDEMKKRNFKA